MVDRRFKIKADLALHNCTLAISPNAAAGVEITGIQCNQTTTYVSNVMLYV